MIYVIKAIIIYDLELTKSYVEIIWITSVVVFVGIGVFSAMMNSFS